MSTTPVPKETKPTYADLDAEREANRKKEEADRQSRIKAEQERQEELKPKPVPLQKDEQEKKSPLEVAQQEYEKRKAAEEATRSRSAAEQAAREEIRAKELADQKAALDERQREYEDRVSRNTITEAEKTQFEIDQQKRVAEWENEQAEFQAEREREQQARREAAGQSAQQQEQRERERQQRERERQEKEAAAKARREQEKQDWNNWNNQNKQEDQMQNEYPLEFDSAAPDFSDYNLSQYNPGSKVTATKPECETLAKQLNEKIDEYWAANNLFSGYAADLSETYNKFEESKEEGKLAFAKYIQAIRAMKALYEACKRLNKCNDPDAQANMNRYAQESAALWATVKGYISFIRKSLETLKDLNTKLKDSFEDGKAAGESVRNSLKPDFLRCEAGSGKVKVSISSPDSTDSDSSGTTDTAGTSGTTEAGTEDADDTVASGASGASESSGASGMA